MYTQTDIDKIKALILNTIKNAENIVLFGSYARGVATSESDMDLAVLTNSAIDRKEKLELLATVRRAFAKNGYNADILIKEKKIFLEEITLPTISRTIQAEGKYIWTKA